jgi:hypothetical protein
MPQVDTQEQHKIPKGGAYEFALQEQERLEQQAQKDREDRNFEINGNGVWLVDHLCPLCMNNMMWNGSSTAPHVHCPRCHVQLTREAAIKMFPRTKP